MTENQRSFIRDLLTRAGVSDDTLDCIHSDTSLMIALDVANDLFDDRPAPDVRWLRDYFTVNGLHMVLTEEGWIPADQNTREVTGYDPAEVLDEVDTEPFWS